MLGVVAILIALTVVVPLAYIEGSCGPASSAARRRRGRLALPAIDEPGYRRKLDNTYFTFPEWYIVYSFEDFGRFLDRGSESGFAYSATSPGSGAASAPSTARCRRRRSRASKSS